MINKAKVKSLKGISMVLISFLKIGLLVIIFFRLKLILIELISKLLLLILFKLLLLLILFGSSVNKILALENCLETIILLSLDNNSNVILLLFLLELRDKIRDPEWSAFEIIKFLLELNLFLKSLLKMIKGLLVLKFVNVMKTFVIFNYSIVLI